MDKFATIREKALPILKPYISRIAVFGSAARGEATETSDDDTVYFHHILDAVAQIEEYVEGMSENEFLSHSMMRDAVVRQIEINCGLSLINGCRRETIR